MNVVFALNPDDALRAVHAAGIQRFVYVRNAEALKRILDVLGSPELFMTVASSGHPDYERVKQEFQKRGFRQLRSVSNKEFDFTKRQLGFDFGNIVDEEFREELEEYNMDTSLLTSSITTEEVSKGFNSLSGALADKPKRKLIDILRGKPKAAPEVNVEDSSEGKHFHVDINDGSDVEEAFGK